MIQLSVVINPGVFSNAPIACYHTGVNFQASIFKSGYHLFPISETECKAILLKIPSQQSWRSAPPGPLWLTFETIGAKKTCRLFQKSIPAARHGCPSMARSHSLFRLTFETIDARKTGRLFQKSIPAARHGRPSTARSDWLLKQSAQGSHAICFKSPFQWSVATGRPRPAPTALSDGLLKQSAQRKLCHLFQKSIPAARHGQPSTARSHGPLWWNFETLGVRNPYHLFKSPSQRPVMAVRPRPALTARSDLGNNRRQESVPFVSKVHPGGPSRTSVTARSHELLKQTAPHTAATMGLGSSCLAWQLSSRQADATIGKTSRRVASARQEEKRYCCMIMEFFELF